MQLPITINVAGISTIHHHPEQAILALHIQSDGTSRNLASSYVTTRANLLHRQLRELAPRTTTPTPNGEPILDTTSPVTTITLGALRSWMTVPRDKNNNPLHHERIYHASIDIDVTFRSFTKLGKVAKKMVASEENVEISRIVWQLTEETREVLGVESRKKAMQDAIRRAQDYAAVIAKEVEAVEITDMENRSNIGHAKVMMVNSGSLRVGEEEFLDMSPPDIEFRCSVQVQFRSAK